MKVGELVNKLREDGWQLIATTGSHRQFKHPTKPGRGTVAGKPIDVQPPGTLNSIIKRVGWKKLEVTMRYAIVIEKALSNYAAYVLDLSWFVGTGGSVEETKSLIREAIAFRLEGL